MRARTYDLDGLLELPHVRDAASRRASFRQGLANLARAAAVDGPSPLDGIAPEALARSVKSGLDSGLFEDLSWLSPAAVGVAIYELAAALPVGVEKRELGRRVVTWLHEGSAEVFAAIATRMALGTRKGLTGSAIRARVSLLFSARGSAIDAGPLAFAFCSRRELAREWIAQPSTGSLPARKLAARMLERAAVAAARRASQGDDFAPRVFATDQIAAAFARLLADREPLVWRHAAVARGILAGISPPHWKAIVDSLHPRLTPTEWRRGAVSMVAAVATMPERALPKARDLVGGALAMRDPGLVATMVWGLPRVLDAEPEAGEQLLEAIVDTDAEGAAEGIAAIVRDVLGLAGRRAVATARTVLADRISRHGLEKRDGVHRVDPRSDSNEDDGELLVAGALEEELSPERGLDETLRDTVARGVTAWVEKGSREAHAIALVALDLARVGLSTLEGLDEKTDSAAQNKPGDAIARRTSVLLLRDLDAGLLEDSSLGDLLMLRPSTSMRPPSGKLAEAPATIDELHDRFGRWLLTEEEKSSGKGRAAIAMSGRRLRALLHLVDAEGAPLIEGGEEGEHGARVRARRTEVINVLIARLAADGRTPLHRTICATLARALDALVRDGTCDPVDVMLVAATRSDAADIATLGEASMDPDVCATLRAYARFVQLIDVEEPLLLGQPAIADPSVFPPPFSIEESLITKGGHRIEALLDFSASLGDDRSGRADALRAVLGRIGRALRQLDSATSRKSLIDASSSGVDALAGAVHAFSQMEQGAILRILGDDLAPASTLASSLAVAAAGKLAALLSRISEPSALDAKASIDEATGEIDRLVPPALAKLIAEVLERTVALPYEGDAAKVAATRVAQELPAWLGPRRTIGGFFIVRPLGGGGAASVFVAKRAEERHEPDSELFALKVPDYDGAAARSLSEQEFLEFFRAEASALLGLPADPNLARFVTFDLGARPKPILVMELIEGPTLERFVAASEGSSAKVTAERALGILDGVLAGLEVMHRYAIGHLDVKPSNVILRDGMTPTLVDFGLAGRHVRPGCATGPYGAPEVWGVLPEDFEGSPSPLPADVYAFGALAFEVLTGRTLFDADTEIAIISKHLTHDGHPEALDRLATVRPLVELIEHSLRHDPRNRWTVPQLRAGLRALTPHVKDLAWPLGRD